MLLCPLLLPCAAIAQLATGDVQTIIAQAATRALDISPHSIIAVVDREGFVLGVWNTGPQPASDADIANAIAKAGTAAFLSSNGHAFSSRTAGFIVQQHFPPGVENRPPGPLVGVNFSNLSFSDVNRYKGPPFGPAMEGGTNGAPVASPITGGLAGSPGGVPLYRNGILLGGVGVAGDGDGPTFIIPNQPPDADEDVAMAGQVGFEPSPIILGSRVFIDGIRVAYVKSTATLSGVIPFANLPGSVVAPYSIRSSPPVAYPTLQLGGQVGEVRQPIRNDPFLDDADPLNDTIHGQSRLTASEVTAILDAASKRAAITRAGIRLPRGKLAQVFITVVNNPARAGVAPAVLGTFRTPDATLFSWDVAVQKARTALFFSDDTRAFSTRTVGFLAQSAFPPGIQNTTPGPFLGLQEKFSIITPVPVSGFNPLNGVSLTTATAVNSNLPNGITIFPGGFPLYRNGVLIGGIGVSGDGIDQDDLIGMAGGSLFLPPPGIRADRFDYRNARLPYAKFPRNPSL